MIEKLVEGSYLKRLDNIAQWLERDVFNKESVAQHSFKVAVFTRAILEDIFGHSGHVRNDVKILTFKLECVTHALHHDFDEAIFLRDVSHSVKYNKFNGNEVRQAINHFVEHQFVEEFKSDEIPDSYQMFEDSIVNVNQDVKAVVKVADWLALLYYCRRELALGNHNFEETYEYCKVNLKTATDKAAQTLNRVFENYEINSVSIKNAIDINFVDKINNIIQSSVYGNKDY